MAQAKKGKYIVIEGMDGAGTTTQRDLFMQYCKRSNINVITIEEPGGTPIGQLLRKILKDSQIQRLPISNLDMFMIARRELADQIIKPALQKGIHVISDRNWLSSYAYQGYAEGLDTALIANKAQETLGELATPDGRILLDIPVEVSRQRLSERGAVATDYFENKGNAFFEAVRNGYLEGAKNYDYTVIDGTAPIAAIHQKIVSLCNNVLVKVKV